MAGVKHPKIALDEISNFPADIISFILSLLTFKEAARTSILSRRWRYLWKTCVVYSLNLNLDFLARKYVDFPRNEFGDCIAGRNYYFMFKPRRRPGSKTHKFVGYSYQILHLDHSSVKDSFRLRFYLEDDFAYHNNQWIDMAIAQIKEFTQHVDQWMDMAIAEKSQSYYTETDLSHLVIRSEIYHDGSLYYQFPSLFSTQEIGSSKKYFNSCSVRSCSSNGYGSLADLRLKEVLVDRDSIVSILSDCPNLEKLCLSNCKELLSLKICGPSLKLKELTITLCENLKKIEINATNLTRFQYDGYQVKFVSMNVPCISTLVFRTDYDTSYDALIYACGKLSSDFPQLEYLMLPIGPIEGKKIPRQLPLFSNLKELILEVETFGGKLWELIRFLQAYPNLCKLELNLYVNGGSEQELMGDLASDMKSEQGKEVWKDSYLESEQDLVEWTSGFSFLHLEGIILSGFSGFAHEIQFAAYLLKNAPTLKRMTIFSRTRFYDNVPHELIGPEVNKFKNLAEKITSEEKKTEDTWELLGSCLRPGVKLLFA